MLYESDVIASVCSYLREKGYEIERQLNELERGDDIISVAPDGVKCFIEAKGETSSKENTSRYGKPFDSKQVATHVAKAFYREVQMMEENSSSSKVGIALPNTEEHKKKIWKINKTLKQLAIEVFWVHQDKSVSVLGNWDNTGQSVNL